MERAKRRIKRLWKSTRQGGPLKDPMRGPFTTSSRRRTSESSGSLPRDPVVSMPSKKGGTPSVPSPRKTGGRERDAAPSSIPHTLGVSRRDPVSAVTPVAWGPPLQRGRSPATLPLGRISHEAIGPRAFPSSITAAS